MRKIINLDERRRRKPDGQEPEIQVSQAEIQEQSFRVMESTDSWSRVIALIKIRAFSKKAISIAENFLIRHFELKPEELEFDEMLKLEYGMSSRKKVWSLRKISAKMSPDDLLVSSVAIFSLEGLVSRFMAIRTVKVIRMWYGENPI